MDILVMNATRRKLRAAWFSGDAREAMGTARFEDYRGPGNCLSVVTELLRQVTTSPDVIGIRLPFGGAAFDGPARVTSRVMQQLDALVAQAPLHVPPAITLIETCRRLLPQVPIVLAFETAFFAALPPREHLYAINVDAAGTGKLRRYGFHGLHHEAVCRHVQRLRRREGETAAARVLSICLEPRSEIAAVIGNHPVMVTSGTTPLEGLPGETTCGELDPSIVLMLAKEMDWGPEQINETLTRESGLAGLAGRPTTLAEVLASEEPSLREAREVLRYRMLLFCGAGVAAMGGVDAVVFSGRFAKLGERLGPWLTSKMPHRDRETDTVVWQTFDEPLARIVADMAAASYRGDVPPGGRPRATSVGP